MKKSKSTMQKLFSYIIGIFFLLLTVTLYSQGQQDTLITKRDTVITKKTLSAVDLQQRQLRYEKKVDSTAADRELKRMKDILTITSKQEQVVFQAGIAINTKRRQVLKSYWKKEGFAEEMIRVDKSADSLYQSIVGEKNYQVYKDTLQNRLIQRRQLMEQQGKVRSTDTIIYQVAKPSNQ